MHPLPEIPLPHITANYFTLKLSLILQLLSHLPFVFLYPLPHSQFSLQIALQKQTVPLFNHLIALILQLVLLDKFLQVNYLFAASEYVGVD